MSDLDARAGRRGRASRARRRSWCAATRHAADGRAARPATSRSPTPTTPPTTLIVGAPRARPFPTTSSCPRRSPTTGARLGQRAGLDGRSHRRHPRLHPGDTGFAVMIGLCVDGRPAVGAVGQPATGKVYAGVVGRGAWVEATRRRPRRRCRPRTSPGPPGIRLVASKIAPHARASTPFKQALQITDEINVGSVGLKIGLVAEARRDLYVYTGGRTKIWDTCGPEAILVGGRRPPDRRRRRSRWSTPARICTTAAASSPPTARCTTCVIATLAPDRRRSVPARDWTGSSCRRWSSRATRKRRALHRRARVEVVADRVDALPQVVEVGRDGDLADRERALAASRSRSRPRPASSRRSRR